MDINSVKCQKRQDDNVKCMRYVMRVETLVVRARSTTIGILCLYSTQYEPPTEYTLSFCRFLFSERFGEKERRN